MKKLVSLSNRAIEYLFYALFLLVPIVFAGQTSELFEFNKMWVTFGIATLIAFFWIFKMILLKEFRIKRTPLDIPIILFLASLVVSTLFSLDRHVSFWGYYSRFNGGLLSILTYVFLYYAFVTNFLDGTWEKLKANAVVRRVLLVSLISGLFVVLWGLPSHFGYDPTCLIFRGTFDVSCWTQDFQPTIRIFSTMGQPDWLAGYMAVLIPIAIAFGIDVLKKTNGKISLKFIFYLVLTSLFYLALLYTGSRSGVLAVLTSLFIFGFLYLFPRRKNIKEEIKKPGLIVFFLAVLVISLIEGLPFSQVEKFSLMGIKDSISSNKQIEPAPQVPESTPATRGELGGTDSFRIRLIVWEGALDAFKNNPLFGTGVETFAFAYYKYRPVEHNLVSEWNFLYNKAHNEFLNYLATTGIFGFLSYLSIIVVFLLISLTGILNIKLRRPAYLRQILPNKLSHERFNDPLVLALAASFISILIVNFFGFSVVVMNLYLFLIPAFVFILGGILSEEEAKAIREEGVTYFQWAGSAFVGILAIFFIFSLARFWQADISYAYGYNLNRAGEYQQAYQYLHNAVAIRKEPVFRDELAVNDAILASALLSAPSQDATQSAQLAQGLAQEALSVSDELTKAYPKNIIYWKSRVRILYSLGSIEPRYLKEALEAMKKTKELAPTEASILYNLGVLYGQNNDSKKAAEVLEETVRLKPDYREARFALGLFYHDLAVDASGRVINEELNKKAIEQLEYILKNIAPQDTTTQETLSAWRGAR